MAKCQTSLPEECPWTPDEWKKFGRMEEKIDLLLDRVDNLNHVKKRGTQAGVVGGAAAAFAIGAINVAYSWAKTKWAWIPLLIVMLLLFGCTTAIVKIKDPKGTEAYGFYGSLLQKKSLKFGSIEYNTDSDAAVEAFKAGLEAGKVAAIP